ncbi:MAG TPA: LysM peptidoglycan-binding domain-containing protein [Granulicella sp.]
MADLEALKQKYAGVLSALEGFSDLGAKVDAVDLDGEKLHIKGEVPSKVVLERVWDEIKEADPTYADLHHEIINTGGDEQPYAIKAGDTLSHIARRFYRDGNKYPAIVSANGIKDPNNVPIGHELKLPYIAPVKV